MKFIKLFLLVSVLAFVLPFGAFAHNASHPDEKTQDGHCVMVCHAICSHAILSTEKVSLSHSLPASEPLPAHVTLSYQNPSLDSFKRPPIVIA